jgi:hypothetical protein
MKAITRLQSQPASFQEPRYSTHSQTSAPSHCFSHPRIETLPGAVKGAHKTVSEKKYFSRSREKRATILKAIVQVLQFKNAVSRKLQSSSSYSPAIQPFCLSSHSSKFAASVRKTDDDHTNTNTTFYTYVQNFPLAVCFCLVDISHKETKI